MVPEEHFVLRDLPFYEEAREADTKARQERLEQRENRRQDGTLWRAPGEKGHMQSATAHLPTEKKKKMALVKVTKAPTPAPTSPSTSSPFALDSSVPRLRGCL